MIRKRKKKKKRNDEKQISYWLYEGKWKNGESNAKCATWQTKGYDAELVVDAAVAVSTESVLSAAIITGDAKEPVEQDRDATSSTEIKRNESCSKSARALDHYTLLELIHVEG